MTLKRLMFGCMLGQALKCLTARWTPKAVYFRNAMRVKPSPRTKHIALAGDPQADAAPICLQNTYIPDSLVHQCFFFAVHAVPVLRRPNPGPGYGKRLARGGGADGSARRSLRRGGSPSTLAAPESGRERRLLAKARAAAHASRADHRST